MPEDLFVVNIDENRTYMKDATPILPITISQILEGNLNKRIIEL